MPSYIRELKSKISAHSMIIQQEYADIAKGIYDKIKYSTINDQISVVNSDLL